MSAVNPLEKKVQEFPIILQGIVTFPSQQLPLRKPQVVMLCGFSDKVTMSTHRSEARERSRFDLPSYQN